MKFIRMVFLLFSILCCTAYAHENEYIIIGQNIENDQITTAFILQLFADDFENNIQINENGEVYLKVDKIFSIDKKVLANLISNEKLSDKAGLQNFLGSLNYSLIAEQVPSHDNDEWIYCRNRKCQKRFHHRSNQGVCPHCGTLN